MADFEEMDTINPVFDLVVFRSIKNIGLGLKTLPVIYDMGVDIQPHINDWVGLFYSGWTSVKDVLKYRWAPMLPEHLNTVHKRRRSVTFDVSSFAELRNEHAHFCFLYVTRDDDVVGVSNTFQFQCLPGYEGDLFFGNLEESARKESSFTFIGMGPGFENGGRLHSFSSRKRSFVDSFEMVNNEVPPQKRKSTKERITIRTHDPNTLLTLSADQWENIFRIASDKPVTQKVDRGAVVLYVPKAEPIFDINREVSSISWNPKLRLTFEHRLAILPGPRGVAMAVARNSISCSACAMGKTLLHDLFVRRAKDERKVHQMSKEISTLKEEVQDLQLRLRTQKSLAEYQESRQNTYHLEELFVHNQQLEDRLKIMDGQLEGLRAENAEMKEHQMRRPQVENRDQDILQLLKEGFQGIMEINGRKMTVTLEEPEVTADPAEEWKVYFPKRIVHMQNVIRQQTCTIADLSNTVTNQRIQMASQSGRMCGLKRELEMMSQMKEKTDKKLAEITQRIRSLLRDRANCFSNEWRISARTLTETPTKQRNLKTCAAAPLIRSPPTLELSAWKSRRPERKCDTCGIVFSSSVDPRVIEEHLVFHETYHKKHD